MDSGQNFTSSIPKGAMILAGGGALVIFGLAVKAQADSDRYGRGTEIQFVPLAIGLVLAVAAVYGILVLMRHRLTRSVEKHLRATRDDGGADAVFVAIGGNRATEAAFSELGKADPELRWSGASAMWWLLVADEEGVASWSGPPPRSIRAQFVPWDRVSSVRAGTVPERESTTPSILVDVEVGEGIVTVPFVVSARSGFTAAKAEEVAAHAAALAGRWAAA